MGIDSFFDFIFSNIFIVIIVVVAIFNLFSKSKKTGNNQETNTQQRRTTTSQTEEATSLSDVIEQRVEQAKETFQQARDTFTETAEELPKSMYDQSEPKYTELPNSVEEQRKAQYAELRRRMQPRQHRVNDHKVNLDSPKIKSLDNSSEKETENEDLSVSTHLQKNLNREGLAASIVMAEVLGPPRALNPYRNVALSRKRN